MRLGLLAVVAASALILLACGPDEEGGPTQDIVAFIPWTVGEEASYSIVDEDGKRRGTGVLGIEGENGRLRLVQDYQTPPYRDRTALVVEEETLKPLWGERIISGPEGELDIEVRYAGDSVEVKRTAITDGEEKQRTDRLTVAEHAYDRESSLFLWRTIPFQKGYQASYINLANAVEQKPQAIRVTLRVTDQEMVEVPAGTFQAWRLEIRAAGVKQTAWYATGGSHPLVKYDRGDMVFLLETVEGDG